jgi:hypothetical protein
MCINHFKRVGVSPQYRGLFAGSFVAIDSFHRRLILLPQCVVVFGLDCFGFKEQRTLVSGNIIVCR